MEITIDEIVEGENTYNEMNCSKSTCDLIGCGGCNCFRFSYSGGVVTNYWQGGGCTKTGQGLYAATTEAECLAEMSSLGLTPITPQRLSCEFIVNPGAGKSFQLPTESDGTYDALVSTKKLTDKVYVGDPINITSYDQAETNLSFAENVLYKVKIDQIFEGFRFNDGGDKLKLLDWLTWGSLKIGNNGSNFLGCSNFNLDRVTDILNLEDITTLYRTFKNTGITTFPNIELLNTSVIASFEETFNGMTLTTDSYSKFLSRCLNNNPQNDVVLDAENSKYFSGYATFRTMLAFLYSWIITDNGAE